MEPSFWLESWEEGKRGFHLDQPNPHLCENAHGAFGEGGRILVPLCGATHDLEYLHRCGFDAVGVELSPIAVREVADRDGLAAVGPDRFEKPGIRLLLADFFETTPASVGPITGIWDRAALVALHPSQREAYVAHQRLLLGGKGTLLLNTLDYDATKADGPPWAVTEEAVKALWPEAECIHEHADSAPPRFAAAGITTITGRLYVARLG
ncbi:MAG: hypothetical protein H6734_04910 [Alphaproteobacteria bacterium]|nr:hypothetical protein [Alphaproteobacteria bacterium]